MDRSRKLALMLLGLACTLTGCERELFSDPIVSRIVNTAIIDVEVGLVAREICPEAKSCRRTPRHGLASTAEKLETA